MCLNNKKQWAFDDNIVEFDFFSVFWNVCILRALTPLPQVLLQLPQEPQLAQRAGTAENISCSQKSTNQEYREKRDMESTQIFE